MSECLFCTLDEEGFSKESIINETIETGKSFIDLDEGQIKIYKTELQTIFTIGKNEENIEKAFLDIYFNKLDENGEYVDDEAMMCKPIELNYCPVCGRKLKKEA